MRIDKYLAAAGYTKSRKYAQDLIDAGAVKVDGVVIKKASVEIDHTVLHEVELEQLYKYVSRGGMKLEAALDAFKINVNGLKAVDVGASTGGFTDCLLKRGAKKVYAIDSGIGQLHPDLLSDPRVCSIEKFNARELTPSVTEGECDIAVADVSFISQTYLIAPICSVLKAGAPFVSLIKPQFEAGTSGIGKNGIVTSSAYRFLAVKRVLTCAYENGMDCIGLIPSPITGGDGNREYLAYFVNIPCVKMKIDDKEIKRITLL